MRPSLAFISVEFGPFLFPDAVRIPDTDRDLELIRKPDAPEKASFAGIGSVIRPETKYLYGDVTVAGAPTPGVPEPAT
jgi:hypothetical protein